MTGSGIEPETSSSDALPTALRGPATSKQEHLIIVFQFNQTPLLGRREWSGGAMVLGKLPVPVRPTDLD